MKERERERERVYIYKNVIKLASIPKLKLKKIKWDYVQVIGKVIERKMERNVAITKKLKNKRILENRIE